MALVVVPPVLQPLKPDLLVAVEEYAALVADAERELRRAVELARDAGATWREIAGQLGTTHQSAHQRFRSARPDA